MSLSFSHTASIIALGGAFARSLSSSLAILSLAGFWTYQFCSSRMPLWKLALEPVLAVSVKGAFTWFRSRDSELQDLYAWLQEVVKGTFVRLIVYFNYRYANHCH